jgi:Rod binding domain-containing protein
MDISALASATNSQSEKSSDLHKVVDAARQFEAVLLESFLQPLEQSFSTLPGGEDGLSASGYRDMGTEAVATAIAQAGGLGLAGMVVRNLLHLQTLPGRATAIGTGGPNGIKGFWPYADSNRE